MTMISVEECMSFICFKSLVNSTFSTLFSCFCRMEAAANGSQKADADFKELVGLLLQIRAGGVAWARSVQTVRCRTAADSEVSGVGCFGGSARRTIKAS